MKTHPPFTLGFIGGGNMAAALIAGMLADATEPATLLVAEPDAERRLGLERRFGLATTASNLEVAAGCDTLVLAVKPQVLPRVAAEIAPHLRRPAPLLISIAAGVPLARLSAWFGANVPLVRAMPNTPAMVQSGASALCAGPNLSESERTRAERILRSVGLVLWIPDEAMMDTVTALSGSGPAYFFLLMEAMQAAATTLGLPPDTARLLTLQTALGAARMAIESSESPQLLRQRVTSPGGTTEQAIRCFEDAGLADLVIQAMTAARDRSAQLSAAD